MNNHILHGLLFLIILLIPSMTFGQKKSKKKSVQDTYKWRYEIECLGTGTEGSELIKVWSYSKNTDVAIESGKRNAVHGIIFRGVSGNQNCQSQKPLSRNVNLEVEQREFFEIFFKEGGKYLKFVSLTTDGKIQAGDRFKIGKREYKIGLVVSVRKDELRKDLEAAGILNSLSSGF